MLRHGLAVLILALAVPPLLVGASVWLVASPQWLEFEYARDGFPSADGFTEEERLDLAGTSTLFLTRPSISESDVAALAHRGEPLYTSDEVAHLVDARDVARRITVLGLAGGLVLGTALLSVRHPVRRRMVGRGLELGGWLTIGLSLWIALFAAFAWRVAFVAFHETLFPQGNWQFAESSGLIRLFPEQFWVDSAAVLLVMVGVGGGVCIALGRVVRRRRGLS